ncbi:MAG: DPP IV N-terminal domain-containing protein, partial [Saprospiraceae bacterium]|nr:DPP IV N-terminal domain-containing protein [Saprospiraceae bacterium]
MRYISLIAILFVITITETPAQTSPLTVEDIWGKTHLRAKRVPGFNFTLDGAHYTRRVDNLIVQYSIATGAPVDTLFDGAAHAGNSFSGSFDSYAFSDDEHKLLIKANTERIYRRSTKANFYVYDRSSDALQAVFPDGKVMHCTLSPDGQNAAFVFDNDLYYRELTSDAAVRITTDGKHNHIINGSADWVYEEEFGFTQAFQWSPDGEKIAFYRFDESRVREFSMDFYRGDLYPEQVTFKYPKVGEENAIVTVHIYDLTTRQTIDADRSSEPDGYIPRLKWTRNPDQLVVFRMNRHQNHLQLWNTDAQTGASTLLLEEKNQYFIDITDDLTFLTDGKSFVWTSESSGYNHIYLYDTKGKLKRQLTTGDYDVTSFYGVDE